MAYLTEQQKDFPQWYLDVIKVADLAEYSKVKGCMVIKPWGYAIWERIQRGLDGMIKAAGVQNAYFPLFIPEHFITKEKDHIEGFAPECAIVTHGGGKKLAENLFVRPTSETIIYDSFSNWVKSYRDLPLLINQWANVVRWEMRTRPFLRTTEFLWQEGHTAHATKEDADREAERALKMYEDFDRDYLALPVLTGVKTRKETFAGALYTLCTEALAKDGKAIQAGTSHNLGTGFAEAFNVQYQDEEGKLQHVWQTSWGVSTRLIGTLIVVHGDDKGLRLSPRIAPKQIVGVPIMKDGDTSALEKLREIFADLNEMKWHDEALRLEIDDRDHVSPGFKFNHWESRGVPLRIELGPRDLAENKCVVVRRDTGEKMPVPLDALAEKIPALLDDIHTTLYEQALQFRDEHTFEVEAYDDFKKRIAETPGFYKAPWCESDECEAKIQQDTKATIRIVEELGETKPCMVCGKDATKCAIIAKAY